MSDKPSKLNYPANYRNTWRSYIERHPDEHWNGDSVLRLLDDITYYKIQRNVAEDEVDKLVFDVDVAEEYADRLAEEVKRLKQLTPLPAFSPDWLGAAVLEFEQKVAALKAELKERSEFEVSLIDQLQKAKAATIAATTRLKSIGALVQSAMAETYYGAE